MMGYDYVKRLLDSILRNQVYNCQKNYKMRQDIFKEFCYLQRREEVFRGSSNMTFEEKFVMFLLTIGQD
jgi:hypothetical protein